jgi:DNA gyrase subunit A
VKNTYGDQRRTDIAPEEGEINVEDLIANRGCIITVTHAGYIKRVPTGTYRSQKRGGKGVAGMTTREEDFVQHVFTANTHDYILFFTAKGRVYWEKVYEIPEASRTARGKAIVNLLNIQGNDSIASLIKVQEFNDDKHLVMATKNGVIKKTNLSAFSNPRKDGVIGIRVDGDDQLIGVKLTGGSDEVMLASTRGMSVRFKEDELRDMGRATRGVRGISLSQGDTVKTVEIVDPSETFFVCTEKGYGKRTAFEQYRLQKRGGKGIIAVRLSEKTGSVVSAHTVAESDALMMITGKGKMIRIEAKEVSMIGRATQGVRLINLGEGDKLVSATPFEPAPEDEAMRDQDG